MDVEQARAYLLTLPHTVETMQWGDTLVFWVGDKAIGGKMFCLVNLDGSVPVISYPAGPERFAQLLEIDGVVPAPYLARIHWVAMERWNVLRKGEWERELRAAHAMTMDKLSRPVKKVLDMPQRERAKLIAERRKMLAEKQAVKQAAKKESRAAPAAPPRSKR
ncbi:MAG: MmcQ/YjbR family DNA-binding protein [Acidobacteria bacterium]|nr:MmcQ/YjbR family DNA-binding protein [Acidobacteriota bacterium]